MRTAKLLTIVLALAALTGCPDGGGVTLQTIQVSPATAELHPGGTQVFTAEGIYSDASRQDITESVAWSSSDEAVATIDETGLATAGDTEGTATITATMEGVDGTAEVTVSEANVTDVIVEPADAIINVGDTVDLEARAVYDDGTEDDVTTTATWASDAEAVATVEDGTVTGVSEGRAHITATFDGVDSNAAVIDVSLTHVLESIQITPADATVSIGGTQQYLALGTFADGTSEDITDDADLTWASSDTDIATIDAGGEATGVAEGDATITAEMENSEGTLITSNDAILHVSPRECLTITLDPVTDSIQACGTTQLTATCHYDDGTSGDVTEDATWASSDEDVATVSNASGSEGEVSGVAEGVAQITATAEGVTSGPSIITVTPCLAIVSIAVEPDDATVAIGLTQEYTATATYEDGTTGDITDDPATVWDSEPMTIATITSDGVATGVAVGDATISATVESISGTATLHVTDVEIVAITVDPATAEIPIGTTQAFTALADMSDGTTGVDVTATAAWVSSDTGVATIDTAGLATGVAVGMTTITATIDTIVGTATLEVTDAVPTGLTVTPGTALIPVTGTVALTAEASYSSGPPQNVTLLSAWVSANPAVAAVSAAGVVTGVALGGPVTVRATFSGFTASAEITVSGGVLTSITVTPATPPALPDGRTLQFTATGNYSDGNHLDLTADTNLTWISSVPTVASVSNAVGTKGLATALTPGATNVTARYYDAVTLLDVTSTPPVLLQVSAAVLQSIVVTPAAPAPLPDGRTLQFTATGTYSDGPDQNLTADSHLSWISGTPATASFGATAGLITAQAPGTTDITARYVDAGAGIDVTSSPVVPLTVTTSVIDSITIAPATDTLPVGFTVQLVATAHYSDGTPIDITNSADWLSSAPTNASVTATGTARGLVEALAAGASGAPVAVTITANIAGAPAPGSAVITVTSATLSRIDIEPADATVDVAGTQVFAAEGWFSDGTHRDVTGDVGWERVGDPYFSLDPDSPWIITGVSAGADTAQLRAFLGAIEDFADVTVVDTDVTAVHVRYYLPGEDIPDGLYDNTYITRLVVGVDVQVYAIAEYPHGRFVDVTGAATWTSTQTSYLMAVGGYLEPIAQGTSNLSATFDAVPSAVIAVTVYNCSPNALQVTPGDATIGLGGTQQFQAQLSYGASLTGNCTTVPTGLQRHYVTDQVTWSASPTSVAGIGADGLATAAGLGDATIGARWSPLVAGNATLHVTNACITGIDMFGPDGYTMPYVAGWTTQASMEMAVHVTYSSGPGAWLDDPADVSWSGTAIGTGGHFSRSGFDLTPTGVTTAVETVIATVTACSGTVSATLEVESEADTLTAIELEPASSAVHLGEQVTYTAWGEFVTSLFLWDVTGVVTAGGGWSSTVPTVATMTANVATASSVNEGTTMIRGTIGPVTGVASLTVNDRQVNKVRVRLVNPASLPAGGVPQGVGLWFAVDADYVDTTGDVWENVTDYVADGDWDFTPAGAGIGPYSPGGTPYPQRIPDARLMLTTVNTVGVRVDATFGSGPGGPIWASDTSNDYGPFNIRAPVAAALDYVQVTGPIPPLSDMGYDGTVPPLNYRYGMTRGSFANMMAMGHYIGTGYAADFDVTIFSTWTAANVPPGGPDVITLSGTLGNEGQIYATDTAGIARVTATYGAENNYSTITTSGTCNERLEVTPGTVDVPVGLTATFVATVYDSEDHGSVVTGSANWAIVPPGGTYVSYVAAGQYRGLAVGSADVTASYATNVCAGVTSPLTDTGTVNVTAAVIEAIDVDCFDPNNSPTATTAVPAHVWFLCRSWARYSGETVLVKDTAHDVTTQVGPGWSWALSSGIAHFVGFTTDGWAEFMADTAGTGTVNRTFNTITGTDNLTVSSVACSGVTVSPATLSSPVHLRYQFTARANYGASSYDVTRRATWTPDTSGNECVAAPGGIAGYIESNLVGSCSVDALWDAVHGGATWTVNSQNPTQLCNLLPVNAQIPRGTWRAYTIDFCYAAGACGGGWTGVPCTRNATALVTWDTGNHAIAAFDALGGPPADPDPNPGTLQALPGATVGMSTTVSAAYTGLTTATTNMTVASRCIEGVIVTLTPAAANVGVPILATVEAIYSEGANGPITPYDWRSESSAIVEEVAGSVFHNFIGRDDGTTDIIVEVRDNLCVGVTSPLIVETPITIGTSTLTGIGITPGSLTMAVGERKTVTAQGIYGGGTQAGTYDITAVANWMSLNTLVAQTGEETTAPIRHYVQGIAEGSTSVGADYQGYYATIPVTVDGGYVDRIWVVALNMNAPPTGCTETPCNWDVGSRTFIDNGGSGTAPAFDWAAEPPVTACRDTAWNLPVSTASAPHMDYLGAAAIILGYTNGSYNGHGITDGWVAKSQSEPTIGYWSGAPFWTDPESDIWLETIFAGTTAGTSVLTATYNDTVHPAVSDSLPLTVVTGALAQVRINNGATGITIPDGTIGSLYAEARFGASTWICADYWAAWDTNSWPGGPVIAQPTFGWGYMLGVSPGADIGTATVGDGTVSYTDDIGITVTDTSLQWIEVLPASLAADVGENLQYRAIGHFADTSTADLTEEVGPDPDDYCGPACGGGNPDCFSAELVNGLPSTVLTHGVGAGQFRAATAGTVYVDFCCGAICAQSAPPTHPDDERSITVVSP